MQINAKITRDLFRGDNIKEKRSWFAKKHRIKDDFSKGATFRVFSNKSKQVRKKAYVAGEHIGESLMASVYNRRKATFYDTRGIYLDYYMYKHYVNSPKEHKEAVISDYRKGIKKAIRDSFGKVLK